MSARGLRAGSVCAWRAGAGAVMALASCTLAFAQLAVSPASLPAPQGGVPYSQKLVASGGAPPYSYLQMIGSLPPGIVLDETAGTLTGTPLRPGAFDFVIYATDAEGREATVHASGTVTSSMTVGPATLPSGVVGSAYGATFVASGGTPPYAFSLASGTLPSGLSLSAGGTLGGTPLGAGSFTFTVAATDANGFTVDATRTLSIGAPVALASGALPPGVVGVPYSTTLAGSGGRSPYTFALTSGTLPAGLTLAADGTLSGTPLAAGAFPLTFTVTDQDGFKGSAARVLTIGGAVGLGGGALPAATLGVPYAFTLTGMGGTPPYTFALAAGALPPGLSLSPSGTIAGTPLASGRFAPTFTVTDANGFHGSGTRTLAVNVALRLAAPPPAGIVGSAFHATLAATGGIAPYTFVRTGGSLPPGVTLSANGALSGTPRVAGSYAAAITITDAAGNAVAVAATFVVTDDGVAVPAMGATSLSLLAALLALAGPLALRRRAAAPRASTRRGRA